MIFKCGYTQTKKIVNETEVLSFINYFFSYLYNNYDISTLLSSIFF